MADDQKVAMEEGQVDAQRSVGELSDAAVLDEVSKLSTDKLDTVMKPGRSELPLAEESRRPKKAMLISGVAIALALLIGCGAIAFAKYQKSQPAYIVADAWEHLASSDDYKSFGFDGDVSVDSSAIKIQNGSFTGGMAKNGATQLTALLPLGSNQLNVELRSLDGKDGYVKVGGLDKLATIVKDQLPKITGSNDAALTSIYQSLVDDASTALNNHWISLPAATDTSSKTKSDLDSWFKQHRKDLLRTEKLADENVNGVTSYHIRLTIDKATAKELISKLLAETGQVRDDQSSRIGAAIDGFAASELMPEVWISKVDRHFQQITLGQGRKAGEAGMTLRLTLKDVNKPVSVEKPADAKPFMEILTPLILKLGYGATPEMLSSGR